MHGLAEFWRRGGDGPLGSKTINESGGQTGGEAGIRTLGTAFEPYNGLANRRFRPLSHLTAELTIVAQELADSAICRDPPGPTRLTLPLRSFNQSRLSSSWFVDGSPDLLEPAHRVLVQLLAIKSSNPRLCEHAAPEFGPARACAAAFPHCPTAVGSKSGDSIRRAPRRVTRSAALYRAGMRATNPCPCRVPTT